MAKKLDLETLLRSNPQAAEHADSIKATIAVLRKLRASGIHGDGYTLVTPYGPRSTNGVPKTQSRRLSQVRR
jgi:hypothetical protein